MVDRFVGIVGIVGIVVVLVLGLLGSHMGMGCMLGKLGVLELPMGRVGRRSRGRDRMGRRMGQRVVQQLVQQVVCRKRGMVRMPFGFWVLIC